MRRAGVSALGVVVVGTGLILVTVGSRPPAAHALSEAAATTVRASVSATGGNPDGDSSRAALSSDGHVAVFHSTATNLVAGDPGPHGYHVYWRDLVHHVTRQVDVAPAGAAPDGTGTLPAVSHDGRYVAFQSDASNLVAGDGNHAADIFRRDMVTGTTIRVSVSAAGAQLTGASTRAAVNADGRYVAFASNDHTVVAGDHNGQRDVFIRDLASNTNTRASVAPNATDGLGCTPTATPLTRVLSGRPGHAQPSARPGSPDISTRPSLSADGHTILFVSGFCNLVPGDTNHADDVFVRTYPAGS